MSLMQTLNVPVVSSVVVKKNPRQVFELADQKQTGVYVLNRSNIIGVMVTVDQYEALLAANRIEVPSVSAHPEPDNPDQLELLSETEA